MDTVTELTEVKPARKYRRRTADEKCRIVEKTLTGGRSVAEIARSHEVNANQVFDWRKQYLEGRLGVSHHECTFLPVAVNETDDSSVADPPTSELAAPLPGKIRIQLARGDVHVEGSVDLDTLRVVPKFASNLGADYDLPWVPGLSVNGRIIHIGAQY
ncbi:transposase [Caballeronia sp. BR00000012568055]|uniref:IS66-like element accessory protein TnpA n=1 Tax=Caballeronia sp. BR00000012568055 TaxID=2918761 RepID=UPI0034D75F82